MKKILAIICLLSLTQWSTAQQIDRSKRPQAAPAPEIKLSDPATFELPNGLKVFVVQNNKLPRISVSLVLNNDPVMEGDAVGYVDMTGELIRSGTKKKQKAEIDA
jgi:predicted Zn-dependent peptidase